MEEQQIQQNPEVQQTEEPPQARRPTTNPFSNRQNILFKISSLTYPVDLIPMDISTRPKEESLDSVSFDKVSKPKKYHTFLLLERQLQSFAQIEHAPAFRIRSIGSFPPRTNLDMLFVPSCMEQRAAVTAN